MLPRSSLVKISTSGCCKECNLAFHTAFVSLAICVNMHGVLMKDWIEAIQVVDFFVMKDCIDKKMVPQ